MPVTTAVPPAGPAAGTAAAPAAGAGGLAGFQALMAALFGAPPASEGVAAAGAQPQATPFTFAPAEGAAGADTTVKTEAEADAAPADKPAAAGEPAADPLLTPPVALAPPAPAPQAPTGQAAEASETTPPAWGRDKAAGAPAAPAVAHADPNASLVEAAVPTETPEAPDAAAPIQTAKNEPPPPVVSQVRPAVPPPRPPVAAPSPAPVSAAPMEAAEGASAPPPSAAPEAAVPPPAAAAPPPALGAQAAPPPPPAPPARTRTGTAPHAQAAADAGEVKAPAERSEPTGAPAPAAHAQAVAARHAGVEAAARAPAAPEDPKRSEAPPPAEAPAPASEAAEAAKAPAAPVRGAPETVANLAAQIVKKLDGRSTRFDVQLDPAGLGQVDVRIEVGAQGRVTAAMTFENPQAAAELKARAGELQRALEQAGFDLSGGLSFDVAEDRGHARQDWSDGQAQHRAFRGQAFESALETAGDAAQAALSGAISLRRGVTAGVDVRI